MRIFISGVAGFLGSHLAESFIADGHEVIGCDNMLGGELDNVPAAVKARLPVAPCTRRLLRLLMRVRA